MKILKKILLVLVVLAVIVCIAGFLMPAKVHVERSGDLKASPQALYATLNNLETYNDWMPWNRMDPNMQITFGASKVGPGASYSWKSENKNVGEGSLSIAECVPDQKLAMDLKMKDQDIGKGTFELSPMEGGTKVKWSMDSDMGMNPIARLMGNLMMDKFVGAEFEKGLKTLESVAIQKDIEMKAAAAPEAVEQMAMPNDSIHSQMK